MSPTIKLLSPSQISSSTGIEQILTVLLKNRHLTKATYKDFIKPPFPSLKLPQIQKSVKRIKKAISAGENILIYGDYDVDGVTSTAILWQVLNRLGAKVVPFLPHREIDGYGFKSKSFFDLQKQLKKEFDLLITVDNGIVASAEFAKIKQNIDVIVVDHHLPDSGFKNLESRIYSLVHSTEVSGAALSWALSYQLSPAADLGLAAFGTVADVMPLIGINRQIVVHGLQSLRLNPSPGFRKLAEVVGSKLDQLSAYDLGFILGPRINAVGRLSSPKDAFDLLVSEDISQINNLAALLNSYNQDRQLLQKESLDLAKQQDIGRHKLIFISDKSFHPGIIGLIAGRLAESNFLPSVVISIDGDIAKGSCRSIPELNIIDALRSCFAEFVDLGGHAGAAGFTILTKNIPKLKTKLTKHIDSLLKDKVLTPTIEVDTNMSLSATTVRNCKLIQKLAPFGVGNREPLFLFKKVKIISKKIVGSTGDHLSLKLDDPTTRSVENTIGSVSGIAFKKGYLDKDLKMGDSVDVVASLSVNHWQGRDTPQLIVKEIIKE